MGLGISVTADRMCRKRGIRSFRLIVLESIPEGMGDDAADRKDGFCPRGSGSVAELEPQSSAGSFQNPRQRTPKVLEDTRQTLDPVTARKWEQAYVREQEKVLAAGASR